MIWDSEISRINKYFAKKYDEILENDAMNKYMESKFKEIETLNKATDNNELRTDLGDAYEAMRNRHDCVHRPAHYQGKVECIDAIESAVEGLKGIEAVCTANVIKYVYRWKKKNGKEDLLKAKWYLNKLIEKV